MENVLVPCAYSPTYVVKDFPIARYQGLQFVSVSLGTGPRSHGHMAVLRARIFTWVKSSGKHPLLEGRESWG